MRSSGLIFVALGCGLVASLGVYQYLKAASKQDETRTVLVVDDDMGFRDNLKDILEDHGYLFHCAGSGAEGMRLAVSVGTDGGTDSVSVGVGGG